MLLLMMRRVAMMRTIRGCALRRAFADARSAPARCAQNEARFLSAQSALRIRVARLRVTLISH